MHKKIARVSETYRSLVLKKLYPAFDQLIKKELAEYEDIAIKIQRLYDESKSNPEGKLETKEQVLKQIESIWNTYEPEDLTTFINDFLQDLGEELNKLPLKIKTEQLPDRFSIQQEDGSFLKAAKLIKRFLWQITQLPKRILRRKITYWKHKVPLRMVAQGTMINLLTSKLLPALHEYYVQLMRGFKDLHAWEVAQFYDREQVEEPLKLDVEEVKKAIAKVKRELKKEITAWGEESIETLVHDASRIGTIEQMFHKYHPEKMDARFKRNNLAWKKQDEGWITTFDTFLESWRSELGIQILMLQAKKELLVFTEGQSKNVHEYIGKELNGIDLFIKDSQQMLGSEEKELISAIKKRIYQTQKSLDQELIPSLLDKLGNKNMINGIARLEASTIKAAEALSVERKIPKEATDYLSPLQKDQVTTISPRDIIAFEIAPALGDRLNSIKAELVGKLQDNILIAQDLDHMISYSLSSAIEEYDNSQSLAAAKDIANESLQRSAARVEDVRASLKQSMEMANERISIAVENYIDALQDLTYTENVREIRMRIARAKAIQSTEEYREEFRNKLKATFSKMNSKAKLLVEKVKEMVKQLRDKLSLSKEEDVAIEVANFLIDSQKVIDSLPLIYRNLYRISPVTDQELYVGRSKELNELKAAYSHWQEGKRGAIAVIGEKWSGLTSFINHVEKEGLFKYKCNRFIAHSENKGRESLIEFLGSVLGEELNPSVSWSDLAHKLNASSKKVMIIEDTQGLYFRKVGGLDHLIGLSELIQRTSQQILWVITCNLYSWQYFQKTILLDESFRFEIQLKPPSPEEIEQLIEKRNRISGYKLDFIPSEEDQQSKRFRKLSEEKQQRELKNHFFRNLIEFSSSNISLALMFWLLSTEEVTKDQIKIKAFKKPNFSFLSALSMDKVFTLHKLILHDGLTSDQMADLSRVPKQTCHMLLSSMQEDGILLMKEDAYLVNPLIYRSIISLLTTKNLL